MSVPRTAVRSRRGFAAAAAPLCAALALAACEAGANYPQTTFRPVSAFGDALNNVFYNTFAWTMAILVLVVGLILYAAFRFRERPDTPQPEQIHGNTTLEIMWTIVPAIIVVFIGVPTVRTIFETQRRPPEDALVVEVIGHQWWWEFRYPELDLNTANQMWVPVGRPISLVMRSADVVHSFWIPQIGGKRDVNPLPRRRTDDAPAHPNYLTFTVRDAGHYPGQCAEFCGESHAIMRMSVMAVDPPEFDAWVARMRGTQPVGVVAGATADTALVGVTVEGQPAAVTAAQPAPPRIGELRPPTGAGSPYVPPMPDTLLQAEGKRLFLAGACVACHAVANTTAVGAIGPNLTLFGTRPTIGAGAVENSFENLVQWIRDPHSMKPGTLMPGTIRGAAGMPPTGLTDAEVRAIAAYLLSLR